jgi:hypothetical protein
MYQLKKKIGKVFTSKFVGTGPSSYEKRIYWAAVSQRFRNNGIEEYTCVTVVIISVEPTFPLLKQNTGDHKFRDYCKA